MAITFIQKKKIQKYLVFAFVAVGLITSVVLWQGFFTEPPIDITPFLLDQPKIEINVRVLESEIFKELQSPQELLDIPENIGRANPFLSF